METLVHCIAGPWDFLTYVMCQTQKRKKPLYSVQSNCCFLFNLMYNVHFTKKATACPITLTFLRPRIDCYINENVIMKLKLMAFIKINNYNYKSLLF